MKKLTLMLDELTVETFETSEPRRDAAGTVRAHLDEAAEPQPAGEAVAYPATYYGNTCPGYPTCNNYSCQSCMQTCGYTQYPCCQIG
ncbi:MAG TPA: hypothetical protein VFJ16_28350 [Longimicrobium sp.]|nr:hypothetical protein [Longimicrobium sp.]